MPHENITFMKQKFLMTSDEIFQLSKIFVELGVNKIRLTGGEPTIRKDFGEIISKISVLPVKIGLTTNGLLLDRYLETLLNADISSINISIDSLKKEKFRDIAQRDHFDKVWKNIQLCLDHHIHVKLNMVVMKDINHHEIFDFVNL
jgi:cyclic pyranopterin phosphate synthase